MSNFFTNPFNKPKKTDPSIIFPKHYNDKYPAAGLAVLQVIEQIQKRTPCKRVFGGFIYVDKYIEQYDEHFLYGYSVQGIGFNGFDAQALNDMIRQGNAYFICYVALPADDDWIIEANMDDWTFEERVVSPIVNSLVVPHGKIAIEQNGEKIICKIFKYLIGVRK